MRPWPVACSCIAVFCGKQSPVKETNGYQSRVLPRACAGVDPMCTSQQTLFLQHTLPCCLQLQLPMSPGNLLPPLDANGSVVLSTPERAYTSPRSMGGSTASPTQAQARPDNVSIVGPRSRLSPERSTLEPEDSLHT